jgi:hypothetical protein
VIGKRQTWIEKKEDEGRGEQTTLQRARYQLNKRADAIKTAHRLLPPLHDDDDNAIHVSVTVVIITRLRIPSDDDERSEDPNDDREPATTGVSFSRYAFLSIHG